jgi:FKBP-type peptidyl-prolyl cis-trans isomerase FkpA
MHRPALPSHHPLARNATPAPRVARRAATVATSLAATLALAAAAVAQTPDALARAAAEPGAVVTPSGLVYRPLAEGKGASPTATDTVRVHYRGTLPDGTEFDSSIKRGQPSSFPLNRVIKCWTEGVQRMKVGGKARLTCPAAIAYGERGAGNVIPPNATLVFEVELLAINP